MARAGGLHRVRPHVRVTATRAHPPMHSLAVTGSTRGGSHVEDALPVRSADDARLHGVDALRGVAALLVMLFHYTTRYQEKFGHVSPPAFEVSWGYLGVNLFFMISGFVIFMTLERTRRPADFLVSRFSRLFPAYWVAALVTWTIVQLTPELGKNVSPMAAIGNGLMFHGLLGIPNIDGVYWTLEVELLFYWAMFLLWLTVGFAAPARWLMPWLALSIVAAAVQRLGFAFPYIVSRVFILPYFPYFAIGVLLYLYFVRHTFRWRVEGPIGVLALLAIALIDPPSRLLWTAAFVAVFVLAAFRWQASFAVRALALVGIVSYPLYLLHETIGWTLIHRLEARAVGPDLAIAIACATALTLAFVLHVAVERPAMRSIRSAWKRWSAAAPAMASPDRRRWIGATVLIGAMVLVGNRLTLHG
jgi:peptidoglycan/LPS O-acetylase OafA/YrhL